MIERMHNSQALLNLTATNIQLILVTAYTTIIFWILFVSSLAEDWHFLSGDVAVHFGVPSFARGLVDISLWLNKIIINSNNSSTTFADGSPIRQLSCSTNRSTNGRNTAIITTISTHGSFNAT